MKIPESTPTIRCLDGDPFNHLNHALDRLFHDRKKPIQNTAQTEFFPGVI